MNPNTSTIKTGKAAGLRNLKSKVLRRIYSVWFWKYEMPLLLLEVIVLIVAFGFFAQYVFVEKVVSNALNASLGNPFKLFSYLVSAFISTKLATKGIIIVIAAGILLFLKDINKGIINYVAVRRNRLPM